MQPHGGRGIATHRLQNNRRSDPARPCLFGHTKRKSAFVTMIGLRTAGCGDPVEATCWNVVELPISGTKCFGIFSRDTGHSRVPAPPHRMTGVSV